MVMTMQAGGQSTGGKKPCEPTASDRFRGVPSLMTCEVPVLEIQTTKAAVRTLRTRKVESDNLVSTTKEVAREDPFKFMELPPEIRLRIYEMCVPVTEYITYDERDYCTCGGNRHRWQNHTNPEPNCTYTGTSDFFATRNGFTRRQPGCFYMVSPHYIIHESAINDRLDCWRFIRYINARMTPRPGILEANSLIRKEALPVSYKMNEFVFEDCECSFVTRWIFKVVQPENLKNNKSITRDGPLEHGGETLYMEDNTLAQMSTIIKLKHPEILGDCKIRLMPADHDDVQFACILHNKISALVERKDLTATHATNEKSKVDEAEVNGLIYCIAKKISDLCNRLHEDNTLDYLPSGLGGNSEWKRNCDCEELEDRNIVPWIGMKSASIVDEGT